MGLLLPQEKPYNPELDWLDPINRGLVGAWPLGEGRGVTARDISGYNNHGTINLPGYPWAKSHHGGQALSIPGTNAVSIANSPSMNIVGPVVAAAWVFPTVSNVYQTIFSRGNNGGSRQLYLGLSGSGVSKVYVDLGATSTPGDITVTPNWTVNQWNFVVLAADGTNLRIYINKVLCNTTATAALPAAAALSLCLGAENNNGFPLNGLMDMARLWSSRGGIDSSEADRLYGDPCAGFLQNDMTDYRALAVNDDLMPQSFG